MGQREYISWTCVVRVSPLLLISICHGYLTIFLFLIPFGFMYHARIFLVRQNCHTPFMVFSVAYTLYEGPKLDASRSQSVTPTNCQYDPIHQHK